MLSSKSKVRGRGRGEFSRLPVCYNGRDEKYESWGGQKETGTKSGGDTPSLIR